MPDFSRRLTSSVKSIKLIAIDVDGTLFDSRHTVTPRTRHAVRRAIDAGYLVVIATGKTRTGAALAIEQLALRTPGVYVQGLVLTEADGSIWHQELLAPPLVVAVAALARREQQALVAYSGHRIITTARNALTDQVIAYREPAPQIIRDYAQEPVNKFIFMAPSEGLEAQLVTTFGAEVSLVRTQESFLELMPANTSKGAGLARLLARERIAAEQVLAIGDGDNDIEMLQQAGIGVAMGNASPALKAVADVVVASHDEDGVAEAVERFLDI